LLEIKNIFIVGLKISNTKQKSTKLLCGLNKFRSAATPAAAAGIVAIIIITIIIIINAC
jgi:hypothetical protein